MSTAGNNTGNSNTIDLDRLSLDELQQLRQREDGRLQALTPRLAQLSQAQARIVASQHAVSTLQAAASSQQPHRVMIPLTESVYVPATVSPTSASSKSLLVELGTGFFCEKNSADTLKYLDRKLQLVEANRDNVTQAIQATRHNLEAIQMSLQGKLLEIRAKQECVRHRNAVEGNA
jgi:prefoldin alpha subunit